MTEGNPGHESSPPPTPAPSLAERIRARYGPGVDPDITLEPQGADAKSSDFSAEVLARLASRPDASGRYRIQGEVARGGQGAVLRVWDEELRRHLAMKVTIGRVLPAEAGPLPPGAGAAPDAATPLVDARTVGRFLEEAQVTSQLDHPGIVPVHELGLDNQGRVFFTMKLVKGEDLKAVFARVVAGEPDWTVTRVLSLLLRVCEAMSYAHAKRVIHRDLKPGNIMVGRYGEVYVMDWGLSRVLDRKDDKDVRVRPQQPPLTSEVHSERRERAASDPDSPLVTMDGDIVGTPAYMSPEQASGKLEQMGPPSDVYALGAMLYHLLTGRMPYVTPDARVNNYAILSRVQEGPPQPVGALAPEAPAELVAICEKAMARDPRARYADTSALAEDLRAYLEHRVVTAYETGAVAELRKWVVRNKPLAAALAAGVLLLIGGLTVSLALKARSDANAALATQKTNDVLSLSAIQELKELVERADALWPAVPEMVPKYEQWLAEAQVLVEGSPTHPGLKEHESKLAEIRLRAQPITAEQAEQDRRASPSFAEWEESQAKLTWMRRMLGELAWPSEDEVEAALAQESLPADARGLNELAWLLVDPDPPPKVVYGKEIKGLILARRAVAAAAEAERANIRDTLAWALYRCGRPEEALAEERRAVDEALGEQKEHVAAALGPIGALVARWAQVEQKQQLAAALGELQTFIALWAPGEPRSKQADDASKLSARVADLERDVSQRRTYEFADAQDRWWHTQLSQLVADLNAFTDEQTGLDSEGDSEQNGWGIAKRADIARTIGERSVSGTEAQRRWSEAIDAIGTSPQYDGLMLKPQLGLLPIGADRESGLWEFWHLQSGDEPHRGADGKLVLTESMGVVLVLIPGGTFWMGAQKTDPAGQNYDTQAEDDEGPVHEVTLSPYFLSKYELTQSQWEHFVARNPSYYSVGSSVGKHRTTLLHPVEQVSWVDAMEVLPRLGLELPTEAQWERGARGGTDTPWSTGRERDTLIGAANLADQSAAAAGVTWFDIKDWPELDDGWVAHAVVGSFRANAFGLHDVHGNVWEWCRDGYSSGFYAQNTGKDPYLAPSGDRHRVLRGVSFGDAALFARSAYRLNEAPVIRSRHVGLRPAKGIAP
jgi:formylglycine-generating enzyme required for sulfatase activity/serine/threonine protein kinase